MRHFTLIAFAFLCLPACSNNGPVNMTENACEIPVDCAPGTYCDPFTHLCGWDCQTDAECAPGMYCQIGFGRCLREETPPPPPDASPVLEITAGPMEDLTVLAGTADAELVRFTLTNRSDRTVELSSVPLDLAPLSGFGLGEVLGELKIRNERTRVIVAGPIDLSGALIDTMTTLTDAIVIGPGESVVLAVRADLQASAETEFDLTVGLGNGQLGLGVSFADSGEPVDETLIANDFAIVRHINVRSETATPTLSGRVEITTTGSGGYLTLDRGTAFDAFTVTVVNGTDGAVVLGDPTMHFFMYPASGLLCETAGDCTIGIVRITDSRDGSELPIEPGSCGGGAYGESCYFRGLTLATGESVTLTMSGMTGTRGGSLLLTMGEGGVGPSGIRMSGHLFATINDTTGAALPGDVVVGNDTALFTTLVVR